MSCPVPAQVSLSSGQVLRRRLRQRRWIILLRSNTFVTSPEIAERKRMSPFMTRLARRFGKTLSLPVFASSYSLAKGMTEEADSVMQSCVISQSQIKSPSLPHLLRTTVSAAQRVSLDMGGTYGSSAAILPAYS